MMVHDKRKNLLTDQDLVFVDSLLDKYNAEFVNSIMLHGFFTGLVCSPTLIMPSTYMPVIWGQNNQPNYESIEEATRLHVTCGELWNLISGDLHNNNSLNFPFALADKNSLLDWLEGFLHATTCLQDDWKILAEDKEASSLLALIVSMHQKYKEDKDIDLDKDDISWLIKSIAHIYRFFLALRTKHNFKSNNFDNSIELSATRKIKRNELCPCGSGKKYKKCCIEVTFH
jgi:uncharacterized protein